jgi:hypothetical protein
MVDYQSELHEYSIIYFTSVGGIISNSQPEPRGSQIGLSVATTKFAASGRGAVMTRIR